MTETLPPLYIVTVNYHSREQLRTLLASLAPAAPMVRRAIIVNHSPEEDLASLTAALPLEIIVQANKGYGAGLNRGLAAIPEPDAAALLLNPDVALLTPAALVEALVYLQAHPRVGCLIPRMVSPAGEDLPACRTFYTFWSLAAARLPWLRRIRPAAYRAHLYQDEAGTDVREVDWGAGAAMLYRVAASPGRPAFDERFFLYFEDVDLCARLWQEGWTVARFPDLVCRHDVQRRSRTSLRFFGYHLASLVKFILKYRGLPSREDLLPVCGPPATGDQPEPCQDAEAPGAIFHESHPNQPQMEAHGDDTAPPVSVILPVYCHTQAHRSYLAEALTSLAAQTFRDFEVILVDDVSPLSIDDILEKTEGLPHLRVLRPPRNLGHVRARNLGIDAARGEFIAFLDHDDLWHPEKLAWQLDAFAAHPGTGLVFCDVELFGPAAARFSLRPVAVPLHPDFAWFACRRNYIITVSAVMVRKDLVLAAGRFDPRYTSADDFDLWLKIARLARLTRLPAKLTRYRLHGHNVNYAVDLLNDNRLLTSLIWQTFTASPWRERLRLAPALARKLAGRAYFTLKARKR